MQSFNTYKYLLTWAESTSGWYFIYCSVQVYLEARAWLGSDTALKPWELNLPSMLDK